VAKVGVALVVLVVLTGAPLMQYAVPNCKLEQSDFNPEFQLLSWSKVMLNRF
jgi:hypothetical protein